MNIITELQDMLRSRNYEVAVHIGSDSMKCIFPTRVQYPPSQSYEIEYRNKCYPPYAYYHLLMADIVRRCRVIGYDPTLISLYKNNKPISQDEFVKYIKLSKPDIIKHNKIGDLVVYAANVGVTPEVINEAKKSNILDYFNLISFLTIFREDEQEDE